MLEFENEAHLLIAPPFSLLLRILDGTRRLMLPLVVLQLTGLASRPALCDIISEDFMSIINHEQIVRRSMIRHTYHSIIAVLDLALFNRTDLGVGLVQVTRDLKGCKICLSFACSHTGVKLGELPQL